MLPLYAVPDPRGETTLWAADSSAAALVMAVERQDARRDPDRAADILETSRPVLLGASTRRTPGLVAAVAGSIVMAEG